MRKMIPIVLALAAAQAFGAAAQSQTLKTVQDEGLTPLRRQTPAPARSDGPQS